MNGYEAWKHCGAFFALKLSTTGPTMFSRSVAQARDGRLIGVSYGVPEVRPWP